MLLDAGALVNGREADALRQVLEMLEHGPGAGWGATIIGRDLGPWSTEEHKRILAVYLWIGTWIRPTLRGLVDRYWRPSRTAREISPRVPSTLARRLRETIEAGIKREERNEEEHPYWIAYYKSIALEAIRRVEELETSEVRS